MKIVGKIFVVLTLLMSLVLLAFAISISSWEPHWREIAERPRSEGKPFGLKDQLADVKAANGGQKDENEKIRNVIQRIKEPNSPHRRQRQSLQVQVGDLQEQNDADEEKLNQQSTEVRIKTAQIGSMQRNLTKRVADMERLLAELRDQLKSGDKQFQLFVASHDTLQIRAAKIHEGEEHFRATTERVARGKTALVAHGVDPDSPPEGRAPRVRGVITSLGTRDLIELSIGEDDGLRAGHTVELYRDHKYLGRAEVVRTAADKSVAKILKQYQKALLQKGDSVATRLKIG